MKKILLLFVSALLIYSCQAPEKESSPETISSDGLNRYHLPIQPPESTPVSEMDARNVEKPDPFQINAPEGSPNVVVVLIDDIGFGATSTFGGGIATPTFDRLANAGLRFNHFHTTALCSPTRAA